MSDDPTAASGRSKEQATSRRAWTVEVGALRFRCQANDPLPFRGSHAYVSPQPKQVSDGQIIRVHLHIGSPQPSTAADPPSWIDPDDPQVTAGRGWHRNPRLTDHQVRRRLRRVMASDDRMVMLLSDSVMAVDFARDEVWQWVDAPVTADLLRRDLAYLIRPLLPLWGVRRRALFLHASGVGRPEGDGYLFLARSGGGKSTVAGLAPDPLRVLGDDHVCVDLARPEAPRLLGSPFNRLTHGPSRCRLRAVCLLRKAASFSLCPLTVAQALPRIWADNTPQWVALSPDRRSAQFDLLWSALCRLPLFEMSFPRTEVDWSALGRAARRSRG